jgi:hypothetical protein
MNDNKNFSGIISNALVPKFAIGDLVVVQEPHTSVGQHGLVCARELTLNHSKLNFRYLYVIMIGELKFSIYEEHLRAAK